jgi:hypothetical protein
VGSSGEPFGESGLPEGSGNIARPHKSRREEEAKENDQVHCITLEKYTSHQDLENTTDSNS